MPQKAIMIGAGQIGRGFIGQVLFSAGYQITFVEVSPSLVDSINHLGAYPVIVMGAEEHRMEITGIRAFLPTDDKLPEALAEAELVTTAVGPSILTKTAPTIVQAIRRRMELGVTRPLNVIACENIDKGSSLLKRAVFAQLSQAELAHCAEFVGFPDAEVSRMVMPIHDSNPLTVKVEQYVEWVIDKAAVKGTLLPIQGLELTDKPEAYIKRKMFSLTGHAMLGYLGYQKGYQYIFQAAFDDAIFSVVFRALAECGQGWSREYGLPEVEFYQYITVMLRRFSDSRMQDPCTRICREPLRKLGHDERFVAPALTALKHGISPDAILVGIRAALDYNSPEEPQAVQLRQMLQEQGLDAVLETVLGLDRRDQLFRMIKAAV